MSLPAMRRTGREGFLRQDMAVRKDEIGAGWSMKVRGTAISDTLESVAGLVPVHGALE